MKTQGEIEAAICEGISRLEQEYRGRGPKDIHAYLLGDFVVVRLQGLLTPAEQQLAKIPASSHAATLGVDSSCSSWMRSRWSSSQKS